MSTDRELLELAAKAVGIRIEKSPFNGGGHGNDGFDIMGSVVLDWHNGTTWNPLADDGDALRLAVKLKLAIFPPEGDDGDFAVASVPEGVLDDFGETWFQENVKDGDKLAATRRAIVCAAAEIGRAIP